MASHRTEGIRDEGIRKLCNYAAAGRPDTFDDWYAYISKELRTNTAGTSSTTKDYESAFDQYLSRHCKPEDVLRLKDLRARLLSLDSMKKSDAFMYFLIKFCEEKKKGNTTADITTRSLPLLSPALVLQNTSRDDINNTSNTADCAPFSMDSSRRQSVADTEMSNVSRFAWSRAQDGNVSEQTILKELLFAFQGIGGETFKDDIGDGNFRISSKVSAPILQHAAHLVELGSLRMRVQRMIELVPLVGAPSCLTALVTAIKYQLNEFCRLNAQFETQLNKRNSHLTLLRVRAMIGASQTQMRCLATVAEVCKDKKGGALLSVLHGLMQHGDPRVQKCLQPLLAAASRPFYEMLAQWLKEGHIDDPYSEFFVAVDSGASRDDFWHYKFSIRESMQPSFMSLTQARLVLATGKTVAFLRELCNEPASEPMKWTGLEAALSTASTMDARSVWAVDGALQACIDSTHSEVSGRAMAVMLNEGKLSQHLQALRRYLLLGQGDFVRQLMENLAPKLSEGADKLYTHQLMPLLDSAIRSTNAQHEDSEVLSRLDVKLMQCAPNELGWDIFSLRYCVDGPIAMIFTNEANLKYLCLFNALWRAKRMEWVLSNLWQRQTTSSRFMRKIPELTHVLRETMLLVSEMNQLVRQMQYYLMFESVECQWSELQYAVANAPSLDHLITAHDKFLSNLMRRALLTDEEGSAKLLAQLRTVYNSVTNLEKLEAELSKLADAELIRRNACEKEAEQKEKENKFSSSVDLDAAEARARRDFSLKLKGIEANLRSLGSGYQNEVKTFLLGLALHTNEDLQFLSYRLDFNEYYKNADKRLSTPLTLDFRRRSGRLDVNPPMSRSLVL